MCSTLSDNIHPQLNQYASISKLNQRIITKHFPQFHMAAKHIATITVIIKQTHESTTSVLLYLN